MRRENAMTKTITKITALSAAALLAGCATIPAANPLLRLPEGSNGKAYMAMGTEPGWTAEITPGQINYNGNYGDTQIRVPVTAATPVNGGMSYQAAANGNNITLAIRYNASCSDGMSDRLYADDVTITANGQTYRGCGGAILPPISLEDTSWRINSINGIALTADQSRAASFGFADGRVQISVGCNRMSGSYKAENHGMTVGPIMSTRMGCPPAQAGFESAINDTLKDPLHLRYTPDGELTLMGTGGKSIALSRNI